MKEVTPKTRASASPGQAQESRDGRRHRLPPLGRSASGQAVIIAALLMMVLFLFVGLGVDVAFLMATRAKLQSAVDSAALSAASELTTSRSQAQAMTRAYQMIAAGGVPADSLTAKNVAFPAKDQVQVSATQRVETFFMRLVPTWAHVDVSADATADASAYAEILAKPYGVPGVVNELNLMVWGQESQRYNGDPYSPRYSSDGSANEWHTELPYGYLFRIDVPAGLANSRLVVQIFDPDTYNRADLPPTPCPSPGTITTTTTTCTPTADMHAYCATSSDACTTRDTRENTGVKLNAFPNRLPAFWRVDEIRDRWNDSSGVNRSTETTFSLWHFNPYISSAFEDPFRLSDHISAGGSPGPIASYTVRDDPRTDLRWYQPPNFHFTPANFQREPGGGYYFYIYVRGGAGSSENNYDLRVGPAAGNPGCTDYGNNPYSSPCYVNEMYYRDRLAWNDGGAVIFAKRALPLNLVTGVDFPIRLTQVTKNAAGQTLSVRHFDQDCNNGCGSPMVYQMQTCSGSWIAVGTGYVGPSDGWYCDEREGCDPRRVDPETVQIPPEGTDEYNAIFGSCDTSWLRIASNPSYSQDTTVWELPYVRPRLIE